MSTADIKNMINNIAVLLQDTGLKIPLYNTLQSLFQRRSLWRMQKIKPAEPLENNNPRKIIFHCVHTTHHPAIFIESMLAKTLQLMGHHVKMVICAGYLDNCTGLFTVDMPPNKGMCKNCFWFGTHLFDAISLDYITYNQLLNHHPIPVLTKGDEIPTRYLGVDLDKHARHSTHRYLKGGEWRDDIYKERLWNAYIAVRVAEAVHVKEKPDIIVTSHSCYSEWGSFADYFRLRKIPVRTWYRGYHHKTLIFDLFEVNRNFKEFMKLRDNKYITFEERKQLTEFVESRRKMQYGDTKQYKTKHITSKDLMRQLDENCYTFTLFPNLPWDVDPTCRTVFGDVKTWILKTIELIGGKKGYQLLIKVHPAEKLYRSKETLQDWLLHQKLPTNVYVINPEVSAYMVFDVTDCGIVSNSTVGLEMLLSNIPVIVVGDAHYKGLGFTVDVYDEGEYEDKLFNTTHSIKNKNMRDIYAYYYFIKSFIPIPLLRHRNFLDLGWNIKNMEELLRDRYLEHITNYIINGSVYQNW